MEAAREAALRQTCSDVKKRLRETKVTLDGTDAYRKTHRSLSGSQARKQEPVLSIRVPNSLFVLWDQYVKACNKLQESPGSLTACIGDLVEGISLNCQEPTLEKRINTEYSRCVTAYKKLGGARRQTEMQKHVNLSVFRNEVQTEKAKLAMCK